MTYSVHFAGLINPTGQGLDGVLAQIAQVAPVPVSIAGVNSLTLTPYPFTPDVTAYSTLQPYVGVAAATNNGPVTASIPTLAPLSVFKDTALGPVTLSGVEIISGALVSFNFDPALAGGAGGFHLSARVPFTRMLLGQASLSWASLVGATTADQTIAITGVKLTDSVLVGLPGTPPAGNLFFGFVPSAGIVTIRAANITAGTITPPAGTYSAVVFGQT